MIPISLQILYESALAFEEGFDLKKTARERVGHIATRVRHFLKQLQI